MSISSKKSHKPYTVIIGCGRLGASLANSISDEGGEVLVIDKDKTSSRKLSSSYGGLFIVGDGTNFEVLNEANIQKADKVIVVTDNDNVNSMIAHIAHIVFNVNDVVVRLYDPQRECVYKEYGFQTIAPAVLSAKTILKEGLNKVYA